MNDQTKSLAIISTGNSPMAIIPTNDEQVSRIAQIAKNAGMVRNADMACLIIMHGLELGLPPMAALERITLIKGRRCIWGDAVPGLPIGKGLVKDWHEEIVGEGDDMRAICTVTRKDKPTPVRAEFSVADAKAAGLWQTEAIVTRKDQYGNEYTAQNDSPWFRYPKRMLKMRARVAWRDAFPDVFTGLSIVEEISDDPIMRDITPPKEAFRKVENPMADPPAEPESDPAMDEVERPEQERNEEAESDNEAAEAAAETTHGGEDAGEVQTVAETQQPRQAPTEPAGEPEPKRATQQAPKAENAQATVLRDLVTKANAKYPETFPLEVVTSQPGGFYQEGLATIANAVDAGKLNSWWRNSRKERIASGMSATELDSLTQAYNKRFMTLSSG